MIILDYNQVAISNLMVHLKNTDVVQEDLVRHMILNSIRAYRQKFTAEYGELVIACDDRDYWRKDVFPYYKAHRKEDRKNSLHDRNKIFESINKVREELKEYFPYRVLQVNRAEADDIIGVLVRQSKTGNLEIIEGKSEKIMILSGDKDFGQLQIYPNVKQYSPVLKKMIRVSDPVHFLREHIIRGDRGDGIPNFLSEGSCIINKKRQSPISTKKVERWVLQDPEQYCDDEMLRNYKRNEMMIDLKHVPLDISNNIINKYKMYQVPKRSGLLNYFIKKRLKHLTSNIGEF